jgi:hypothetical protein
MSGGIVIAIILVLAPIFFVTGCTPIAVGLAWLLQSERDEAFEGTELGTIAHANPYAKP